MTGATVVQTVKTNQMRETAFTVSRTSCIFSGAKSNEIFRSWHARSWKKRFEGKRTQTLLYTRENNRCHSKTEKGKSVAKEKFLLVQTNKSSQSANFGPTIARF